MKMNVKLFENKIIYKFGLSKHVLINNGGGWC